MTDQSAGRPSNSPVPHNLIHQVTREATPAVHQVLATNWDLTESDLEPGIQQYTEALIAAVEACDFAPLEAYLISLDPIWTEDTFAISPVVRSMFIIEDAITDLWDAGDPDDVQPRRELIANTSRRAIECLTERSVSLVMGRLEERVQEHREGESRLISLQRVGAALVSDLDLDRSLQLIVDEARTMIGADGVVIRMADDDGNLVFVTGSGNERLFMRTVSLPARKSLSGESLRTGTPACVDDIRTDPRANRDYLNVSDGRSLLIVPLITRNRPVGVITGASTTVAAFSDRDISILSLFADQAASAIENARLYQQAKQQIDELEAVHRVSQLVSSSLDLEEVFQTLYEEVARLMPSDAFMVSLSRPDGLHDFEFIIDSGQRYPPRRGRPLSPILSEPLMRGQVFMSRDVTRHPLYRYAQRFGNTDRPSKSVLAAPLMRGDEVIGMISTQSYAEHDYRDLDSRILRTIASQAAIAIEHARLYRQAQNVAIAEERARLAREIHDTLAQGLIGVILCLERLDISIPADDTDYRPWIERALDLSRSGLEEARRSVRDLRAAPLEGRTLLEAVANLVADVRDGSEFAVTALLPASLPALSARVETALFRVIQEAIANASKHAECNQLLVELDTDGTKLALRVYDDGAGFLPDTNWEPGEHYGLATMRERVLQIGGEIDIQSASGQGTTVRVEVPLPVAVHREWDDDSGARAPDKG